MKAWFFIGEYSDTADTWSEFAGGAGTSPWTSPVDGQLKGLRVVENRDAATSLQDHTQIRLTCATFGIPIHCGGQGSGLQTAPALQAGMAAIIDWECDVPVRSQQPITVEGRNIGADTQVTPSVLLYGMIEYNLGGR